MAGENSFNVFIGAGLIFQEDLGDFRIATKFGFLRWFHFLGKAQETHKQPGSQAKYFHKLMLTNP